MTSDALSPHVTAYFDLMDHPDSARIDSVFAQGAVVTDDGHTYRGHEQIREWINGPASEFTTTSTRISSAQSEAGADVVVLLGGNFPGGRVELHYRFTQQSDGLITELDISA